MLCCGVCGNMSKRDYKVATCDGIELEPLGGPKPDQKTNGVKYGKYNIISVSSYKFICFVFFFANFFFNDYIDQIGPWPPIFLHHFHRSEQTSRSIAFLYLKDLFCQIFLINFFWYHHRWCYPNPWGDFYSEKKLFIFQRVKENSDEGSTPSLVLEWIPSFQNDTEGTTSSSIVLLDWISGSLRNKSWRFLDNNRWYKRYS